MHLVKVFSANNKLVISWKTATVVVSPFPPSKPNIRSFTGCSSQKQPALLHGSIKVAVCHSS
ncbi:MAG: hypothetical protein LN573_06590 [Rickettsia endosymbiont of Oxypoda opaca]|nr:hypothetical protein [Rickettsia endosymbiont of Oxypoda opaca]